ncbi:Alpha-1,4 glucan phosphorylase L isozyme, chloroplastic/amyloplastic [Apostasia shenzhenica]|uniref:Alpha-1,4 glucan phosphorylase n=1 Tax=Apostasia shenzhenica TaxID=1088818 RepID=A0A2I0BDM3_9ASPA|nr:Alpha-1,4 glucan phosphorylase L isozyme, chloroplastic/amyloplastic [Apostasia shenzhenica]
MQGRSLLNAIGNLELTGTYGEALRMLGQNLENVAGQEPDAALGSGGLGRLASCFLDSLATLNYPAWGYGLRYKYGLFQQVITRDGQEEVAESWLEMGNPWEIVRNDVSYPVKFNGKVVLGSDGKKHWIGGEDVMAVAYDVPIPGYKTKTTLNLRLWSTKVSAEGFDLAAFNAGQHTKANEAYAKAEKICYVLYPGDESVEGKILRLKQQYTLCSASLQDIIARFERRSSDSVNWEEFPSKVALQMNDTHPTLCIPELMRILIDNKALNWKEAWNITQSPYSHGGKHVGQNEAINVSWPPLYSKTVAYTNHTVLPEALEKWSLDLLRQLLPRHAEIIESIDHELINDIISEYGTEDLALLEKKLKDMRLLGNVDYPESVVQLFNKAKKVANGISRNKLSVKSLEPVVKLASEEAGHDKVTEEVTKEAGHDNNQFTEEDEDTSSDELSWLISNPNLPKVVRMASLCVVGGHSVNGVAEIHSDIVKRDVFNSFYQLWPGKFQNKTNGVTPRRWIRFCNPELSDIITKWIGTEGWVVNTEKLAELKKVKRIHEYKRQLLNILGIVYRYKKMKEMSTQERISGFVPRVCIFGGKAFATYVQAKRIVKFITDVGSTINHDPDIGDLLKVIFVPDYNVSIAELLIPGSELSQHIRYG